MFQKLYGHLENISEGLHKSHADIAHANTNIEAVNNKLTSIYQAISKPVRNGVSLYLQGAGLIVVTITALCIIFYVTHSFNREARIPVQRPDTAGLEKQSMELGQRIAASEAHLQKLDSLINEQSQSLKELKTLNKVAVKTLQHIRKHMDKESL